MATTLFSPISTLAVTTNNRDLGFLSKSSFLLGSRPFSSSSLSHHGNPTFSRRCFKSPCAQNSSYDHIPKQFRQENLEDGLMDNFKNVPQFLYGLPPSQINNRGSSEYTTSSSMEYGEARKGGVRRSPPPDLPSIFMDARIIHLALPIVPRVARLIISELMLLDFDDSSKPIYLYIYCSGTRSNEGYAVAEETEAYAIADAMLACQSDIHTLNLGMAYGQAAMLLSLGKKGSRYLMPTAFTKLYLPELDGDIGDVTYTWSLAQEQENLTNTYIELLAKGIGKSEEEIYKDIKRSKTMTALEAIEYGIADKIVDQKDKISGKSLSPKLLSQSGAMRKGGGGEAMASPADY